MNVNANIIDVTPLDHSSIRMQSQNSKTAHSTWEGFPSTSSNTSDWSRSATQQGTPYDAPFTYVAGASPYDQARRDSQRTSLSPLSAIGGLTQVVIGAGLIAIGVPMLILPGPGLLSVGAGALLVTRGLGKLTR